MARRSSSEDLSKPRSRQDGRVFRVVSEPVHEQSQDTQAPASSDSGERPEHHVKTLTGRQFTNPWPTWEGFGLKKSMAFLLNRNHPPIPREDEFDRYFPVLAVEPGTLTDAPLDDIQTVWIGHATFLIQMNGCNILTDPVWSQRCSPVSFMGPKRIRKVPIEIARLPPIHLVAISHNHFDHLDMPTIEALERFRPQYLVPLGLRETLPISARPRTHEFDWWQSLSFLGTDCTLVPAQHWSTRTGLADHNRSLWGGWVFSAQLAGGRQSVFFSGDTGYCPAFREIGDRLGPFDLAILPLGAYCPRDVMRQQHCDPEESVKIHVELRSKLSIGMHWGTFVLSNEPVFDPPRRLKAALMEADIDEEEFVVLRLGHVLQCRNHEHLWDHFSWALAKDAAFEPKLFSLGGASARTLT
mmetsp:Transcript_64458/g.152466  ORF Transcript_64458/g.152466 Transcript_64458/m.152466 type:complete len:412 (+) Transcript_64458:3-1238(+)